MNEREWVDRLLERFGGAAGSDPAAGGLGPGGIGPGDDAALFTPSAGASIVSTVDTLVDGTHFLPGWLTDAELGSRALRVSLSDLAAMAAVPRGALIAVETNTLPGHFGDAFWDGVAATLEEFDCTLLGGNVTRTRGPISISTTLLGEVAAGEATLRSTARPGDAIFVTGRPGSAACARRARAEGKNVGSECAFAYPRPRIREARALVSRGQTSAAIDVSDGLGLDLARLLDASGVGAEVELEELFATPPTPEEWQDAWAGGEDYELLFTAPADRQPDPAAFEREFGVRLTRIGSCTSSLERSVDGREWSDEPHAAEGWDPF